MKHTVDSSTTSEACPKSTSRGRRASGVASGSIPTAITPSTPGRYGNGGSGQSNNSLPYYQGRAGNQTVIDTLPSRAMGRGPAHLLATSTAYPDYKRASYRD